jgi:DNA-binding transcriptional MerR regulator
MTNPISLTTGQVSGATWLHTSTLYRYADEFKQFLSQSATKPGRGRRWTKDDLDVILAIRALHHSRAGYDTIFEALESGWRPPSGSADDRADLARMIETIGQLADQLKTEQEAHEKRTSGYERRLLLLEGRQKNLEIQVYNIEIAINQLKDEHDHF